jgi:hypothetical protein
MELSHAKSACLHECREVLEPHRAAELAREQQRRLEAADKDKREVLQAKWLSLTCAHAGCWSLITSMPFPHCMLSRWLACCSKVLSTSQLQ